MIGLTYLGIYIVTRIGSMVMMMEGVSNSTNQAAIENAHMNPFLLITFTVIMAPIVEELVFRGLLMGRVFNPDSIVGLIVSSLLFGLVHMPNSIGVWIVYAGMGLALGIAYRKFQKLEYCIMAHIINNSIAVSMLLLSFLALAMVVSILETTLWVRPVRSRSMRPAIVVPPGLHTLSIRSCGLSLPRLRFSAVARTVCLAMVRATCLLRPFLTPALARASIKRAM